jgi:hypothetical protein
MSVHKTADTWTWPVNATEYDRAHSLTARERLFLTVELPSRIKTSKTRQPSLDAVQRLARPLHDVFDHIEFKGPKRRSLVFYLLEEMGRRDRALWAWKDAEWIDLVESRRYDGNRIIAAAFLLRVLIRLRASPSGGMSFRVWHAGSSGSRGSRRRRERSRPDCGSWVIAHAHCG